MKTVFYGIVVLYCWWFNGVFSFLLAGAHHLGGRNYGTFVPAFFRSRERKFHRWNFHSLELWLPGTFVPGSENDVELSLPNIIYVLTCWNLAFLFT